MFSATKFWVIYDVALVIQATPKLSTVGSCLKEDTQVKYSFSHSPFFWKHKGLEKEAIEG